MSAWLLSNPGKTASVYELAEISGKAWTEACIPSNIISGFQSAGIYPFQPDKWLEDFVIDEVRDAANDLFSGPETDHRQVKSFQTHLGYVMPVNAELTIIRHNKLNADKHVLANCVARGHVVPFLKQLQQLSSLPEVHDSVYFSTNSSCDAASHMTDIHEGKVFESDDFFFRYIQTPCVLGYIQMNLRSLAQLEATEKSTRL